MKQLSWQTVTMLAVLGAITVGLAVFTDLSSTEITGLVAVLAGVAGAGAVGGAVVNGVQQRVDQIHEETQAQTGTLDTVAKRVNGELDARIKQAVDDGNADLIRLFREQGILR